MMMQISRPAAIGIIIIALVVLGISAWYTFGRGQGGAGSTSLPDSAYPKPSTGTGVESLGAEPLYTGSGPKQSLPLEGQGGKR